MMGRTATLTQVMLIRPGATEFDDQGRMKGSLDMPLSDQGQQQVNELSTALAETAIKTIYCAPCESARATAEKIARDNSASGRDIRIRVIDALQNIDHGLWHGKLIDEVKRNHPKVYRQGNENPDEFQPPEGESIAEAKARVKKTLKKYIRKSRDEMIALVVPDPLASVITSMLTGEPLDNLWKHETDAASWQIVEFEV